MRLLSKIDNYSCACMLICQICRYYNVLPSQNSRMLHGYNITTTLLWIKKNEGTDLKCGNARKKWTETKGPTTANHTNSTTVVILASMLRCLTFIHCVGRWSCCIITLSCAWLADTVANSDPKMKCPDFFFWNVTRTHLINLCRLRPGK